MPTYYEVVEGIRLPARLGGHPALDFCNTWAGWDGQDAGDYLKDYHHLTLWAGSRGLLTPEHVASLGSLSARRVRAAAAVLDRARGFRADLYRVLRDGAVARAWDSVAGEIHTAASAIRLRPAGQAIGWEIGSQTGLTAPLLAAAWSAGELLTSPDRSLVRACPGPGCGWLFLDRSGRRRWCTMATCGNREKARRFAARHRTPNQ
jgi:predicted RNA-binding Zn ribbon-like protein